jgi:hypothetical protein
VIVVDSALQQLGQPGVDASLVLQVVLGDIFLKGQIREEGRKIVLLADKSACVPSRDVIIRVRVGDILSRATYRD